MEINEFNGEGYMPLVSYEGWCVAIANYAAHLREENLYRMERHLKTDEAFLLLQGSANLYIGVDKRKQPLEIGKIYNVKCGEWHCISMTENTKVAIIENDGTGPSNTEYQYFKKGDFINV